MDLEVPSCSSLLLPLLLALAGIDFIRQQGSQAKRLLSLGGVQQDLLNGYLPLPTTAAPRPPPPPHIAMLTVDVLNHKVSSRPEIVFPGDVGPFTVGEHRDVPNGLLTGGWWTG